MIFVFSFLFFYLKKKTLKLFPHNLVEGKVENNRIIDVLIEKIIFKKK